MARNGLALLLIVALAAGNVWCWMQHQDAASAGSETSDDWGSDWPGMPTRDIADLKEAIVPSGYQAKSMQHQYYYKEVIFDPPFDVRAKDMQSGSDMPEKALASAVGSMYAYDYAAWQKNWTVEDQAQFAREVKDGHDAASYENIWKSQLPATRAYIVARADVQDMATETTLFVILAVVFRRKGSNADLYEKVADDNLSGDGRRNLSVALAKTDDGWRLTNRFRDHPVWLMWWSGTNSIKFAGGYVPRKRKNG